MLCRYAAVKRTHGTSPRTSAARTHSKMLGREFKYSFTAMSKLESLLRIHTHRKHDQGPRPGLGAKATDPESAVFRDDTSSASASEAAVDPDAAADDDDDAAVVPLLPVAPPGPVYVSPEYSRMNGPTRATMPTSDSALPCADCSMTAFGFMKRRLGEGNRERGSDGPSSAAGEVTRKWKSGSW